jgi:hypothetical protein
MGVSGQQAEHANTVLTSEVMHLRALGEVELRLRRDLTEELLAGTDTRSAYERAWPWLRPSPPPTGW